MKSLTFEIVRLRRDEHLSGQEIASRVGCSTAHVSTILKRWAAEEPDAAAAAAVAAYARHAGKRSEATRKAGQTRKAMRLAVPPRPANGVTDRQLEGQDTADPNRADRLLRRFSFEALSPDEIAAGAVAGGAR